MNIKELIGSESRDLFRYFHKQIPEFEGWFAGCDVDFVLTDNLNERILALIDYQKELSPITNTERIAYSEFTSKGYQIFLVVGSLVNLEDIYHLKVYTYPEMEKVSDNFVEWEINFRKKRFTKVNF